MRRLMPPVMHPALIALAPLALASCGTTRPAAAPPVCPAVKAYTPDQLAALAAAVRALPPESPVRGLVVDDARLRDEARACEGR